MKEIRIKFLKVNQIKIQNKKKQMAPTLSGERTIFLQPDGAFLFEMRLRFCRTGRYYCRPVENRVSDFLATNVAETTEKYQSNATIRDDGALKLGSRCQLLRSFLRSFCSGVGHFRGFQGLLGLYDLGFIDGGRRIAELVHDPVNGTGEGDRCKHCYHDDRDKT